MDLKCTHGSSRFGGRRRRRKPVFQPSGISTTRWTETNPFPTKCIYIDGPLHTRTMGRRGANVALATKTIPKRPKTGALKQLAVRDAMNPPFHLNVNEQISSAQIPRVPLRGGKNGDSRSMEGCVAQPQALQVGQTKLRHHWRWTGPLREPPLIYTSLEIGQSTCLPNVQEEEEGTQ